MSAFCLKEESLNGFGDTINLHLCVALPKQYKDSCVDIDIKELIRERKQKNNEDFNNFYVSILEQVHELNETSESQPVEILPRSLLQEIQHEVLNLEVYSGSLLKVYVVQEKVFKRGIHMCDINISVLQTFP